VLEDLVKSGASWSTDINQFGAGDVFSGNRYFLREADRTCSCRTRRFS